MLPLFRSDIIVTLLQGSRTIGGIRENSDLSNSQSSSLLTSSNSVTHTKEPSAHANSACSITSLTSLYEDADSGNFFSCAVLFISFCQNSVVVLSCHFSSHYACKLNATYMRYHAEDSRQASSRVHTSSPQIGNATVMDKLDPGFLNHYSPHPIQGKHCFFFFMILFLLGRFC